MGPLLVFFLYMLQLQATIRSEIIESPNEHLNTISDTDDADLNESESSEHTENTEKLPFLQTGRDPTEVEFRYPIASLNIDYSKNLIILKFRKSKSDEEEERRRKSFNENFMRFGRADADFMRLGRSPDFMRFGRDAADFMRFGRSPSDFMRLGRSPSDFMRFGRSASDFMRLGKRSLEQVPKVNSLDHDYMMNYDKGADSGRRIERSQEGIRDSRGDNFMRFGRRDDDFLRFGRSANDFLRFGRASGDFMRFGRNPSDFMRFGRGNSNDFMRFGRNPKNDFMRFGRTQKERRGNSQDFMRFGRPDNFMRFGRTPSATAKQATVAPNFIRYTKPDQNFMRFGKRLDQQANENSTKPPLPREVIKEAAKILHQAEQYGGVVESNPMDRAIKVLFSKDGEHESSAQDEKSAQSDAEASNENAEDDYELNMVQ
ncbi:FMRFamide-related peptides [Zeugodacus cucurbitae]|uniref:FMRFamide neuropeptides n=1 Tax=Zeugodacus cucurbitae TaxID=28588 RepID=A0A0A1XQG5_ZEUCU|nr:FMRFamide-related peptides [Zeugodacus cucurbitae]